MRIDPSHAIAPLAAALALTAAANAGAQASAPAAPAAPAAAAPAAAPVVAPAAPAAAPAAPAAPAAAAPAAAPAQEPGPAGGMHHHHEHGDKQHEHADKHHEHGDGHHEQGGKDCCDPGECPFMGGAQPGESAEERSGVARDGYPLAGWHGGLFYLRDSTDNFRLYFQGRAQIDSYNYFGPGVADTTLKSTVFLRRARPELSGEFLGRWQWQLSGEWGATGNDNPKGTNETSAAAPGAAPSASSGRYASAQTSSFKAQATDVYLNYRADGVFNLQMGQYDAPFTMENRTSDKYLQFMERSLAVRALGIPTNKEIGAMFWGETAGKELFYSVGVFNGDGQNRLNPDNRADVMGRIFTHPLAGGSSAVKDLHIGGSFRYGMRDKNYTSYDYAGMTTQGNYAFWSPIYKSADANNNTIWLHVIPSGAQMAFAGELRVPVEKVFDLTSEFVYVKNQTREAIEGFQATNSERFGEIKGYGYYVQAGFWPMGNRDINGHPGYENPAHIDFKKPDPAIPQQALQLLVKWEQLAVKYESNSRSGTAGKIDGDIKVNAFSLGANYWASKHVRLSANYVLNMFPDSAATTTSSQRAQAPANGLAKGINDDARDNAHNEHELLFRVAVAF